MRVSKLLGVLLLVAGVFVVTRGSGWHFGPIVGALLLGFTGLLFIIPRRVHGYQQPWRRRQRSRPARVRLTPPVPSAQK